jgi:hypothetical protein
VVNVNIFKTLVFTGIGVSVGTTLLSFFLLRFITTFYLNLIIVQLPFILIGVAIAFFTLGQNGALALTILLILVFVAFAITHRKFIPLTISAAETLNSLVMSESSMYTFGSLLFFLTEIIWTPFWAVALFGVVFNNVILVRNITFPVIALIIYLLFSFHWNHEVFSNVSLYGFCMTVSRWYYANSAYRLENRGLVNFIFSTLLTNYGSLCFASIFMTPLAYGRIFLSFATCSIISNKDKVCTNIVNSLHRFDFWSFPMILSYNNNYCESVIKTGDVMATTGVSKFHSL